MSLYIKRFEEISMRDLPAVGGKNASLGEMFSGLGSRGIRVPDGFATTAAAFRYFLDYNDLRGRLQELLGHLDRINFTNLRETGAMARTYMLEAAMPDELAGAIRQAYRDLGKGEDIEVAVRSSATAEDLPEASFAGQHESYLNVRGEEAVVKTVRKCFASLFTDRAIKYREDNGFGGADIALSAGIQRMVRSDLACSGIGFTLDPESGFRDIIHLSGTWGLGENIVQGVVIPDEFFVFKPILSQGKKAVIRKKLGSKELTMIYSKEGSGQTTSNIQTNPEKREQFVLNDDEITLLAQWALIIEEHYRKPMDIEWAKDGLTGGLYILQARPETVQSARNPYRITEYVLSGRTTPLCSGQAVGRKIISGTARVLSSPEESGKLNPGEIIITDTTSPDWDPVLKRAAGIVTNKGGRTSHASIVARELGVPAVVGAIDATVKIGDGQVITLSCCEGQTGFVYEGALKWREVALDFSSIRKPSDTQVMMIIGDPDNAFNLSFYPNDGVGLMRMEFIITSSIGIHPMALVQFDELKDESVKQRIQELTHHYPDKKQYFTDRLSQGIATIAAAFYPKTVIVRMSDFKSNEYASLLGGNEFEQKEENPMLGFRGASRYYNDRYKEGFRLECEAVRIVRNEMGLTNVKVMIPFCRTVEEGKKVLDLMKGYGLPQHENGLEVYVMTEIPVNVILADDFARIFDGFSIGSNDLTQLTLGIDRDSVLVSDLFDERNEAVKRLIVSVIEAGRRAGIKVGICGQAPSDFPLFARFLVENGIDSIAFNPDSLLKGIENISAVETAVKIIAGN